MTPLVELIDVGKRYVGADSWALEGVSLTIDRGEFVAIVGTSGSGKSSLLNILGLLARQTTGTYRLNGRSVSEMKERERNRARAEEIGFIFQSANMLGDECALTNAALGLRVRGVPAAQRHSLAQDAVTQVGLASRAGSRARLLSGGETQRLAVARAIAGRPSLVLADEPTGNLDTANGRAVMDLLAELHDNGHTVVVITHDPAVAARAERQIAIADGSLEADIRRGRQDVCVTLGKPFLMRQGRLASWVDTGLDAISALSSRPLRTLLLVLAFAIGVSGVVSSSGLSQSAAAQISNRLTAAALDEVRVNLADPNEDLLRESVATIEKLGHVKGSGYYGVVAPPDIHVSRTGPGDAEPSQSITVATASTSYLGIEDVAVMPAHAPTLLSTAGVARVALVSTRAAAALNIAIGPSGPAPGITIWVDSVRVSVVGTFEPNERTLELTTSVIVSSDVLLRSAKATYSIVVRTEEGFPATVAKAIPLALDPANPASVTTQTVADIQGLRIGVADDLSVFVVVLAGLLLTLATVSGATAMYLSVHARTAEIALRRAIGTSRGKIGAMFMFEGLGVGLCGGGVGAAGGLAAVLLVDHLRGWSPVLPAQSWAVGVVVGIGTGLVSAVYPAWLASRQDPALAIKA